MLKLDILRPCSPAPDDDAAAAAADGVGSVDETTGDPAPAGLERDGVLSSPWPEPE